MALQRLSPVYSADDTGFREIGMQSELGDIALSAAKDFADEAKQIGKGTYDASPATVTGGWANEPRRGASITETTSSYQDARNTVLLKVLDSMAARGKGSQ